MKPDVSGLTPGAGSEGAPDGRALRWTEHRASRREELIDACIEAVRQFGPEVGMDQIAAVACTSKPVIYRYFADKGGLYRAVGDRVVARIVETLQAVHDPSDPRAMLRGAVDGYLHLLEDQPQLFRFLAQNRLLTDTSSGIPTPAEFSGAVTALLDIALAEQLTACGLDPAAAQPWGAASLGFIRSAGLWWLENPDAMTRGQLTEYLTSLLWGGAAGIFQSAGRDVDGRPGPQVFPLLGSAPTRG